MNGESAIDVLLGGLASLLVAAAVFGRIEGNWTGQKALLPLGERIAAALLAMPVVLALASLAVPTSSLTFRLLWVIPLEAYAVVLAGEDWHSAFTRRTVCGMNAVYILALAVVWVSVAPESRLFGVHLAVPASLILLAGLWRAFLCVPEKKEPSQEPSPEGTR